MQKDELLYMCRCIHALTNLPVNLYSSKTKDLEVVYLPSYSYEVEQVLEKSLREKYLEDIFKDSPDSSIAYYISDDLIGFGIVRDQSSEYSIYIGPCRFTDLDKKNTSRMLKDSEIDPTDNKQESIYKFISLLSKILPETLMTLLSFINVAINKEILQPVTFFSDSPMFKEDSTIVESIIEKIEFSGINENGIPLNEAEKEIVSLVQSGNIQGLKAFWSSSIMDLPRHTSSVHHSDILRQEKNKFIETTVVVSRAAINAGVNPNYAHTLKDTYILRCENTIDPKEFFQLYPAMLNSFTSSVNDLLSNNPSGNYIVSRAMSYISNHLVEKITAQDICDALNISAGYLSTIFKKSNNISIPEYINQQKINVAKGLLANTDKSLAEISTYLSFSSQSYFQSQFKKFEGMTPTEYKAQLLQKNKG